MSRPGELDLAALARELEIPLSELEAAAARGELEEEHVQERMVESLSRWLDDPVAFVVEVFGAEPDEWQKDALRACAGQRRVAMKACKGPGKSAVLAWFGWWCVALHPHANGYAISITEDNLRDNLWKEMALWYARSPWLRREFVVTAERIFHRSAKHTWWLSARAFAQRADKTQQAHTLAGLHAEFVFVLCDEVNDYPDGVLDSAEGIFTVEGAEAHLAIAGNATRSDGPLHRACTRDRALWWVVEITGDPDDPKRSPRISLEYARAMIAAWGRDNPVVMVNLLGQFPPTGSDKLLGANDITAAEARTVSEVQWLGEAVIWSLDVARFGDDKSHLRKRMGSVLFRGLDFRDLDGVQLANQVSLVIIRDSQKMGRRPDYLFVDTGGVGASAVDHLKLLGWEDILVAVEFGAAADDPLLYQNKRSEMWWRAAQWVKKVGCIPTRSNQLAADLMAPKFQWRLVQRHTVFSLERKEDMKKRGLASPDEGDALAMSFYTETPVRKDRLRELHAGGAAPSARAATERPPRAVTSSSSGSSEWDPFSSGG